MHNHARLETTSGIYMAVCAQRHECRGDHLDTFDIPIPMA